MAMDVGRTDTVGDIADFQFDFVFSRGGRGNGVSPIDGLIAPFVGGHFELDELAGLKFDFGRIHKAEPDFLDVMSQVSEGGDGGSILTNFEPLWRQLQGEIVFDTDLACEADVAGDFIGFEPGQFGGEGSAAVEYGYLAKAAGASASAGRGNEHALVFECREQVPASGHGDFLFAVQGEGTGAIIGEEPFGEDEKEGEHRVEGGHDAHTQEEFKSHRAPPLCGGCHSGEGGESHGHDAGDDQSDAGAFESSGKAVFCDPLADPGHGEEGEHPAETAPEAVRCGLEEGVAAGDHEQGRAEDGAIDGDERKKDAEGGMKGIRNPHNDEFGQLRKGGDQADKGDQGEVFEPQGEENAVIEQPIKGRGEGHDEDHGGPKAERGFEFTGGAQEWAHSQIVGEENVLSEHGGKEKSKPG